MRLRAYEFVAAMGGMLAVVLTLLLLFSIWQTIGPVNHPYKAVNIYAKAWTEGGGTVLDYEKHLSITRHAKFVLYRAVQCENEVGLRYDFPLNIRDWEPEELHLRRKLIIPFIIPRGTKCEFTTVYEYRPTLAWYNRVVTLPPLPFVVE